MYRVIIASASLEEQYDKIYREIEEREWEDEMASKVGYTPPQSEESYQYSQDLYSRFQQLHDKLFNMWAKDPKSVSPELAREFQEEVNIGQMELPY